MGFDISIPSLESFTEIKIVPGSPVIFVGANGSGKTRLAVFIEDKLGEKAHRVSAHRALKLNPSVPKIRGVEAHQMLRYGIADNAVTVAQRLGFRWSDEKPAVAMLDDFDSLLQVLFADQSVTTLDTHTKHRLGTLTKATATKFETLSEIWQRILPLRQLVITGDDIRVTVKGEAEEYSASDMSDGERSIFYLIAQALAAEDSSLIIIDEPELHVHPSIMSSLWDEIEAARKDCSFLFITHDLNFAAARVAKKYFIKAYDVRPAWTVEIIPDNTGFSEEITTQILGSRRPILFVEGDGASLDLAIYRRCYPKWTVIPRGSCEQVIHAVVTMRANEQLTRATCAGIVDADGCSTEEIKNFNKLGVFPLPVSEVENLFLLPEISRAIAQLEGFKDEELEQKLVNLKTKIFENFKSQDEIEDVVVRHCCRQIDRMLKKIDLSDARSINELAEKYKTQTLNLKVLDIAEEAKKKIEDALENNDLQGLLTIYDNKKLLALAATHLRRSKKDDFKLWIIRMLKDETRASELAEALKAVLPVVQDTQPFALPPD